MSCASVAPRLAYPQQTRSKRQVLQGMSNQQSSSMQHRLCCQSKCRHSSSQHSRRTWAWGRRQRG